VIDPALQERVENWPCHRRAGRHEYIARTRPFYESFAADREPDPDRLKHKHGKECRLMKKLLVLGAGSAGTMIANRMNRMLNRNEWQITIVDPDPVHYYQPGFLFMPFDIYRERDVFKPRKKYLPGSVTYIQESVEIIEPNTTRCAWPRQRCCPTTTW
jgi:hypothetical protein